MTHYCNVITLLISIEIGVGLAGFGVAFLFLGMLLLFDKGLLAVGNVSIFFLNRYCVAENIDKLSHVLMAASVTTVTPFYVHK